MKIFEPRRLAFSALIVCATLTARATDTLSKNLDAKPPGESRQTGPQKPSSLEPAQTVPETMPVSELKPGMRGVAYTVFEGTKPEPMDVEILGVLNNANGPKSDMILARLLGP